MKKDKDYRCNECEEVITENDYFANDGLCDGCFDDLETK